MSDQMDKTQPRFAHSEGFTIATHALSGRHVFTAGEDMLVRMFATSDEERDEEARTLEYHTSQITCITTTKELLIVGSEDRTVTCFAYPSLEFVKLLARCNLSVKDISTSHDGQLIAIATEDPSISIKHIEESREVTKLRGHTKPISCVKFAPNTNELLSVDTSGEVRLWREENDIFTCVKQWTSLVHTGIFANHGGSQSISWAPSGDRFAASGASGIMIVPLTSELQRLRSNAYLDKPIAGVVWSHSGHIAIYNQDCKLLILQNDTEEARVCHKYDHSTKIVHLSWHPSRGSIALTDRRGQLLYSNDIVDVFDNQHINTADLVADIPMMEEDDWMDTEQTERKDITMNTNSVEEPLNETVVKQKFPVPSLSTTKYINQQKTAITPLQLGATSWVNSRRYFAYNTIGNIVGVRQDDHVVIRVEFNDKGAFRGFHFTDYRNFTLGVLGEQACLFANNTKDNELASVYYRPFDHLTSNEWTKTLPDEVDVKAMTSSEHYVVLCLSNDWVHIVTKTGIEREIFVLPNVIACAAYGDYALIVATSSQSDIHKYTIVRLSDSQFVQTGDLPLLKTGLKWIGFSEVGAPSVMDNMDTIYILVHHHQLGQGRWTPVYQRTDTRNDQLYYFPIGLSDQQFSCILCPRDRPIPSFSRPIIHELDLKLPVLNSEVTNELIQEEKLLRLRTLLTTGDHEANPTRQTRLQAELDKTALMMIQSACKAEKTQRALELCSMLHLPAAYDAACKIANYHRMSTLVERMLLLKEVMLQKDLVPDYFPNNYPNTTNGSTIQNGSVLNNNNSFLSPASNMTPNNGDQPKDGSLIYLILLDVIWETHQNNKTVNEVHYPLIH
ncbi:WD40-repeat-containing domain protein [Syncephalis fuscata]|nr:WD40-repeat-containing domain protein [Syncephalis fuscata]